MSQPTALWRAPLLWVNGLFMDTNPPQMGGKKLILLTVAIRRKLALETCKGFVLQHIQGHRKRWTGFETVIT